MILDLEQWVPAAEAARELGVSRPRVHQLVGANVLDGAHVHGRLLVHRRSLQIWKAARRGPGRPALRPALTLAALRQDRDAIEELAQTHGVTDLRVFGSVARDEARSNSDVDFLVDLEPGRTVMDLCAFITDLEEHLGRPVDVVQIRRENTGTRRIRASAVPL
ncbi:MAG: nucleotidyltransferase domain-containing protein [Candidatus Dormibacteraeota bacterium]|nr:nucleotidyltransferase domain-containing protein [Candidatus Dormibacteraeota bacterium]